jgi:membrane protease subunit (stomatin/prohibitin family)
MQGEGHVCQCSVTLGIKGCPACGCDCEPWWSGVRISTGDSGAIQDYMSENYFSPVEGAFPTNASKVMQDMEAYGLQQGGEEALWVSRALSQKTFNNLDAVAFALISSLPPISRSQAGSQGNNNNNNLLLLFKYPAQRVAYGQRLSVGKDEKAVLVGADGKKSFDVFEPGEYTLSAGNAPLLANSSRKRAPDLPGQFGVLDGFPVFVRPSMEFEVDLTVMGQSKALRRIAARGVGRFKISDPSTFLEQLGSKGNFETQSTLDATKRQCEEILKKEMANHEFQELQNNASLLEKTLSEELQKLGIAPVKINFAYIGEMGPGMFAAGGSAAMPPGATAMMMDPQKIAQLRQMAEAMRASQMQSGKVGGGAGPFARPPEPPRNFASPQQAGAQPGTTIQCTACKTSNPATGKFCNNCGASLSAPAKKACPKCGQQSDAAIKFCGNCGTKLSA